VGRAAIDFDGGSGHSNSLKTRDETSLAEAHIHINRNLT
jgi:hypothetical protein